MTIPSKMSMLEKRRQRLTYELQDISNELNRVSLKEAHNFSREAKSFAADFDVLLLLLCTIISPALGLAYIAWLRYPRVRWLVIPPLLLLSLVQFIAQWGGLFYVLLRLGAKI